MAYAHKIMAIRIILILFCKQKCRKKAFSVRRLFIWNSWVTTTTLLAGKKYFKFPSYQNDALKIQYGTVCKNKKIGQYLNRDVQYNIYNAKRTCSEQSIWVYHSLHIEQMKRTLSLLSHLSSFYVATDHKHMHAYHKGSIYTAATQPYNMTLSPWFWL